MRQPPSEMSSRAKVYIIYSTGGLEETASLIKPPLWNFIIGRKMEKINIMDDSSLRYLPI